MKHGNLQYATQNVQNVAFKLIYKAVVAFRSFDKV